MAFAKEERNRLFIADWKGKGLSNEELGIKYSMTPGGVKALKQRLRQKDSRLYQSGPTSKPAIQQTNELTPGEERTTEPETREAGKSAIQQASKPAEYKKVTYYLDPTMAKTIKHLALDRDMDISELVREMLNDYLTKRKSN